MSGWPEKCPVRPLNIIRIEGVSCPVNRIVSSGAPGSLFHRSLELRCWGSYTENYGVISRQNSTFAFDIQLLHLMSVCILIGDVGNSTLEFHNAALKFQNTTLISHNAALFVHTWFFLHLFE